MTKRAKIISATVLLLISVMIETAGLVTKPQLEAFSLQATGVDYAKIFIWAGLALLALSALLFVSASND